MSAATSKTKHSKTGRGTIKATPANTHDIQLNVECFFLYVTGAGFGSGSGAESPILTLSVANPQLGQNLLSNSVPQFGQNIVSPPV